LFAEDLKVNTETYDVIYKKRSIHLPQKEFDLLSYMMANKNRVFTREQIFDEIWGLDKASDLRTVDVHIKRLRSRFKGDHPWSIKTVWGVGYKFVERKSDEIIKT
jgi:DNA-binding response OmpR family regulator